MGYVYYPQSSAQLNVSDVDLMDIQTWNVCMEMEIGAFVRSLCLFFKRGHTSHMLAVPRPEQKETNQSSLLRG
jgi:hypothetical protein